MTEPTLEPGETWEDRLASLLRRRDEAEIACDNAPCWVWHEFRPVLDRLRFEIGCVVANLEAQGVEVDW